ncbi:MAG TPA: response regulator [Caulobacteraceae bacterium]|nr:response regulator [Caulobacteraceae bacterium]
MSITLTLEATRAQLRQAEEARRQAESALSSALRDYQLLADNMADLVVHVGRDGRIRYASPSCSKIGYRPADLVGRTALDLVHPDDRERISRLHREMFAGIPIDESEDRDGRIRSATGEWVWFEGNPQPLLAADGEVVGLVTLLRSVTQRRALVRELRQKRREAEAASQAKSDFLANMSHEIRTPLTAILGFSGLLERVEGLPPDAQKYVKRIGLAGQALEIVINDILDFAQIEAGEVELHSLPFDPRQLLEEVMGLISVPDHKTLSLAATVTERVPSSVVGDVGRVRQVLLNLLSNGVKFTDTGSVNVTVDYDPGNAASLEFSVKDTGVGVRADWGERIFERFSQTDASLTRRFGGAGLGLALCKILVNLMGGTIGYESQMGAGSTFWFRVPAPAEAVPLGSPSAPLDLAAPPGANRVLVVDDVAANRELLTTLLRAVGYDVATARDGLEAVDQALTNPFDIILMDLQMPRMDGLRATQAIRAGDGRNCDTPILAVSANALPEHIERCHQVGMNGHITKPINVGELIRSMARFRAKATKRRGFRPKLRESAGPA